MKFSKKIKRYRQNGTTSLHVRLLLPLKNCKYFPEAAPGMEQRKKILARIAPTG
jgi:hypothetical protein